MRYVIFAMLVACGGEAPAPMAVHAPLAADAGVDAMPDAAAAAVMVPDPAVAAPIDEVDTTVADGDLPVTPSHWNNVFHVPRGGEQLVALQLRDGKVRVALVESDNGIVRDFELAALAGQPELHGDDGNTFMPRDRVGTYTGPILFAFRIRGIQTVVFAAGNAIEVVERRLGEIAWSPQDRIELEPDATFVAIGTTDPH